MNEGNGTHLRFIGLEQLKSLLTKIVVGVDPAVTCHDESSETGIVVAGRLNCGRFCVLDDQSGRYPAHVWGQKIIDAYDTWQANCIVAEVNQGGDLVKEMICMHRRDINFKAVRAMRGKFSRAEPVSVLYKKHTVWHRKKFEDLEKQMFAFTKERGVKADRVDAMVWAMTELMHEEEPPPIFRVHRLI